MPSSSSPPPTATAVGYLLGLPEFIDLAIPRGGESLIRRVVAEARMPVMKHYQGNCHVYVDAAADPEMAIRIIVNAKAQRPGVCNAAETLLVHRDIAPMFLPAAAKALIGAGVELRGDAMARSIVPAMRPAQPADWDTEYLDKILAVKVVDSIGYAIEHIGTHGSGHTEAIVTGDLAAAAASWPELTARPSSSTPAPGSTTAASSAWVPRSASAPTSTTPAALAASAS